MTDDVIAARALTKTFRVRGAHGATRTIEAVAGVDLDVAAGEIVGFLGPNGAGKTTTLRMLTTLTSPTSGEATVVGCDLRRDPVGVRRGIGYVAQGQCSTPEARVIEELTDHAQLYGIPAADARLRADALVEQLDLHGHGDRLVKTLSGGQRRRLEIGLGLVHEPRLVFLDEPTTGLDPQSRSNLWEHVRRLRDELGTTVFLTTHYLDEADALCDRVLIIDHGRIVAAGSPAELKRRIGGDGLVLGISGDLARAAEVVAGHDGVHDVTTEGTTLRARAERGDRCLPVLLRALDGAGITVTAIQLQPPSLDDVFLTMTGRSLRDDEFGPVSDAETTGARDGA